MNKKMRMALAWLMAVVTVVLCPLQAYAANTKTYVSEVVTYYADSYEEAKAGLEALGYIALKDSNMNPTLDTGVYLGYKTTTLKSEAITDLAAMNMKGKYSYTDYQEIRSKYREEIQAKLDCLKPAILSYQNSVNLGEKSGQLAKETLNLFYEDDSGRYMGDILCAYDPDNAEQEAELTDILLESSSNVMSAVIAALTLTAESGSEDTVLQRMAEYNEDGGVLGIYKEEYGSTTMAQNAMNAELGDLVLLIQNQWEDFRAELQEAGEQYTVTEGELSLTEDVDDENVNLGNIALRLALEETVIDEESGMTALQYFERPFSLSIQSELFLLAFCLTDAEAGLLEYASLSTILSADLRDMNSGTEEAEAAAAEYEEVLADLGTCSVYEGVDRSYFGDGVAFTSEAEEHETLTGETPYPEWQLSKNYLIPMIVCSAVTVVMMGTAIGLQGFQSSMKKLADKWSRQYVFNAMYGTAGTAELQEFSSKMSGYEAAYQRTLKTGYKVLKAAAFVLTIVFAILDIISIIAYLCGKEQKEETIPAHLVTAVEIDGDTEYVYYDTVPNQDGEPSDLNNHESDNDDAGWLVLYYTKDENAGDPITADRLKCQTGSAAISGDSFGIHLFNETAPLNLTAKNYTGVSDSVNGCYILFTRASEAALGSAIGSGSYAVLYGLIGLALGALAGSLCMRAAYKKKKIAEA